MKTLYFGKRWTGQTKASWVDRAGLTGDDGLGRKSLPGLAV